MKNSTLLILLGGGAVLAWLIVKNQGSAKPVSPVEIDALASNVSQGLSASEEVGLFDRLFGIRDASAELVKLKNSLPLNNKIRICHTDGTCEVQSRTVAGASGANPLKAPKYFLDYLGLTF